MSDFPTSTFTPPTNTNNGKQRSHRKLVISILLGATLLIAGALTLLFYMKVEHRVYYIPSASMTPTLKIGERVATDHLNSSSPLQRGEIVISKPINNPDPSIKAVVKRVVGLPGETIEAKNGVVYINGNALSESYLAPGTITTNLPATTIPAGSYYLLGDNRTDSADSRIWGSVPRSYIEHKVTGRYDGIRVKKVR